MSCRKKTKFRSVLKELNFESYQNTDQFCSLGGDSDDGEGSQKSDDIETNWCSSPSSLSSVYQIEPYTPPRSTSAPSSQYQIEPYTPPRSTSTPLVQYQIDPDSSPPSQSHAFDLSLEKPVKTDHSNQLRKSCKRLEKMLDNHSKEKSLVGRCLRVLTKNRSYNIDFLCTDRSSQHGWTQLDKFAVAMKFEVNEFVYDLNNRFIGAKVIEVADVRLAPNSNQLLPVGTEVLLLIPESILEGVLITRGKCFCLYTPWTVHSIGAVPSHSNPLVRRYAFFIINPINVHFNSNIFY